jgi:hypothetical protein
LTRAAPLLLLLALAACGRGGTDDNKGGLSASESRQLDAAAASIDVNASNGTAQ